MPGSAISVGVGSGSQVSSGSRRARTRQYHKVAHTSQVDESLFGEPHRGKAAPQEVPIETQARERSANKKRNTKKPKKETVQVITKDLIRQLIVPGEDPSGKTMVLERDEFMRIRHAALVLTAEQRRIREEQNKKSKEEEQDSMQERKSYMKSKDLERRKNEKLSEIEEEQRMEREHLKQKAIAQLQEQEDEIKHLNELILDVKCHAIRDAQIMEKQIVGREMTTEEKRLDKMMEVDRQNAIKMQEEIELRRREERLIGAQKIMGQIEENEQTKLLNLERKDQENRMMQKYLDKLCEEEAEKLDKKRATQVQLREELNVCNDEIIRRRALETEQQKVVEEKVIEYQKQKAERETALEKEQERVRIEKERDVARLRAMQERTRDEQAERDYLRAKRAQEQAEREWRKKEAEEMRKKAETEDMLKAARSQQMENKEHFLAVQAQRERAEFERVLNAQQELIEKEKREESSVKQRRKVFADDVRAQIREKEQLRIAERNAFFEEGAKLDEEARARRLRLEEVKKRKLEELRRAGISDKYLAQVERKVNQPQHVVA